MSNSIFEVASEQIAREELERMFETDMGRKISERNAKLDPTSELPTSMQEALGTLNEENMDREISGR